jgi:hypothetical protein
MRSSRIVLIYVVLGALAACGGGGGDDDDTPACTTDTSCDDGVICTVDSCEDGACVHDPDDSIVPDDGVDCTVDTCDAGDEVHTTDDGACDTGGFTCVTATCDAVAGCMLINDHGVCSDDEVCTDDVCDPTAADHDPTTGCSNVPNSTTPPPIDGNCQEEICLDGAISSTDDNSDIPPNGVDSFACTVPACSAGDPVEPPSDAACNDGLTCTSELCDPTGVGHDVDGCVIFADDDLCNPGEACDAGQNPGTNPSGCVSFDTCPAFLPITDGQTLDFDTTGLADDQALGCGDNTGAHPDLAFGFTLAANSDVIVQAHSSDGHALAVAILETTATTCGRELLCAPSVAADAEVDVLNLAAGTYAIIVDGTGATLSDGTGTISILIDPTTIGAGDLVINEMMGDPTILADADAEWMEFANPDPAWAVGTNGLTLVESDGSPTSQTILGSAGEQLIVPPNGFLLGVRTATLADNGGLTPDFILVHNLNNTPNENFQIMRNTTLIDEVDLVGDSFPAPTSGAALGLDPTMKTDVSNDLPANWCLGETDYEVTNHNKGSPGAENESCFIECTVPTQAVDCDDSNPCTDDVCNVGVCEHNNDDSNVPPEDTFSCTTLSCLGGAVQTATNDAVCDDAVDCTVDTCVGPGGAAGTGCTFPTDDNACLPTEYCDAVLDCQPITAGPVITGVNMAVIAHGAKLVITGTDLAGATSVTVGGTAQTFAVDSVTQITIASLADATPIAAQSIVVTTPGGASLPFGITVIHLVINELDCNQPLTDAAEFVEISTGVAGVSLSGYALTFFNGGNSPFTGTLSYFSMNLNSTTDANGLLLVGNSGVLPAPALTFAGDSLQNGSDAVGIHQSAPIANGTAASATGLIDALVYDTNDADASNLLDAFFGAGNPQRVQVDEGPNTVGGSSETVSIERCEGVHRIDGRSYTTHAPTPGAVNQSASCSF